MPPLSFSDVEASGSLVLQTEVPKKVLCGVQTCFHVLTLQKDIAQFFATVASLAEDVRKRAEIIIPTITSPTGEMVGFLVAWEGLTRILFALSDSSKSTADSVQELAVEPLEKTLHELVNEKNRFLTPKRTNSASAGVAHTAATSVGDTSHPFPNSSSYEPTAFQVNQRNDNQSLSNTPNKQPPIIFLTEPTHRKEPPLPNTPGDTKRLQECQRKFFLATEEYEEAVNSRNAILERFGKTCQPSLVDQINQRVDAAAMRKNLAQQELARATLDFRNSVSSDGPLNELNLSGHVSQDGVAPYIVKPGEYHLVDGWELKRLKCLQQCFSSTVQVFFSHLKALTQLTLSFAGDVDRFSPELDFQMWLDRLLDKKMPLETVQKSTREGPSTLKESDILSLVAGVPRQDDTLELRTLRRELEKTRDNQAHYNARCRVLEDQLRAAQKQIEAGATNRDCTVTTKNKMRKPEKILLSNSPVKTPEAAAAGTLSTPRERKKPRKSLWNPFQLSSPKKSAKTSEASDSGDEEAHEDADVAFPISGGDGEELQRGGSDAVTSPQLFRRATPAFSNGPTPDLDNDPGVPNVETHRKTEFGEEKDSVAHRSPTLEEELPSLAKQTSDAEKSHPLFPDLFCHITRPVEQYSGADEAESFVEVQRRFEEFLLTLQRVDISGFTRTKRWDDNNYYKGPHVEESFGIFPYKLPAGLSLSTSREQYFMALEWGAPNLDDFQWECLAYETLLLVYHFLSTQSLNRRTAQLQQNDINSFFYADLCLNERTQTNVSAIRRRPGTMREAESVELTGRKSVTVPDVFSADASSTSEAALQEHDLETLKTLVTLTRVRLKLAGAQNALIVQLMLPSGFDLGRMGQWAALHPLDVRYRAARLLDSWRMANAVRSTKETLHDNNVFIQWVLRQIHILHTSLSFKLWRLARFLPYNKQLFLWLNGWPEEGPWYRSFTPDGLPRFDRTLDRFFGGKLNTLMNLFEMSFQILSCLAHAAEKRAWGLPNTGLAEPRSGEPLQARSQWIMRLVNIMSCIGTLDKLIRIRMAENELPTSKTLWKTNYDIEISPALSLQNSLSNSDSDIDAPSNSKPLQIPDPTVPERDASPSDWEERYRGLIDTCPVPEAFDVYWAYETPMLQLILSFLWRNVTDATAPDLLHVDAPTLASGLMVASYTAQLGSQPVVKSCDDLPYATLSAQTQCLLLSQALWEEMCRSTTSSLRQKSSSLDDIFDDDDLNDSGAGQIHSSTTPTVGVLPTAALHRIVSLLNPTQFQQWFCSSDDLPESPTDAQQQLPPLRKTTCGAANVRELETYRQARLRTVRCWKIAQAWFPSPIDTLIKRKNPRESGLFPTDERPAAAFALMSATDPDFAVVDPLALLGGKHSTVQDPTNTEESAYEDLLEDDDGENGDPLYYNPTDASDIRRIPESPVESADETSALMPKRKKRPDALLRELRFARRKRAATVKLAYDIRALDFDAGASSCEDIQQEPSAPHCRLLSPRFEHHLPRAFIPLKEKRRPAPRATPTTETCGKSRIRTGYDVLHSAGLTLLASNNYSHFRPFETIREDPEGISLICSSRIERIIMEVLFNRLISARFRSEIADVLSNYRYQLEPEALPVLIHIWDRVNQSLSAEYSETLRPYMPEISNFNIQNPIATILAGPSPRYDLYRHFIHQTITSLVNRIFTDARIALSRTPQYFLSRCDDLPDNHDEKQLAMNQTEEVVKLYGVGLDRFVRELRGELEFYPKYWKDLLPGNQHALIVANASRTALARLLDELIQSPYWPEDGVPGHGALVLKGIRDFELLIREVKRATRLDIPSQPDLLHSFSSSVTAALTKQFQTMEETLRRCMDADVWDPSPGQLHSVGVIDLFSFIHHLFAAIADLHAPVDWVVPCFLQFLGRLTHTFIDFLLASSTNSHVQFIATASEIVFASLQNPAARAEGTENLVALLSKKDKKSVGAASLLKNVGKLAHFGFSKKKKNATPPTGTTVAPTPQLSNNSNTATPGSPGNAETFNNLKDIKKPNTLNGTGNGGTQSGIQRTLSELNTEDQGLLDSDELRSEISERTLRTPAEKKLGRSKKNKKKLAQLVGDTPLPPNFNDLATRFGWRLALNYVQIRHAYEKSPLSTWLVRLHNLKFFTDQLPELAQKFQEFSSHIVKLRDPSSSQIFHSLTAAAGRVVTDQDTDNEMLDIYDDVDILNRLESLLSTCITSCQQTLDNAAAELCRNVALRVILCDFGADLFEELYNPIFRRYAFENIFEAFHDTVARFILHAPVAYQSILRQSFLEVLVKCWTLIVTEMGYHGTIFLPEDMDVLEEDLEALKAFCARYSLTGIIPIRASPEKESGTPPQQSTNVNAVDYVNDFFYFIGSKPHLLAQLGGAYDISPTLSTKAKQTSSAANARSPSATPSHDVSTPDSIFLRTAPLRSPSNSGGDASFSSLGVQEHPTTKKKKKKGRWLKGLI